MGSLFATAIIGVAFYPHDEDDYAVYDFGIDEISPYVVSLKINSKGKISDCQIES